MRKKFHLLACILTASSINAFASDVPVAVTPEGVTLTTKDGDNVNLNKRIVHNGSKIFFTAKTNEAGEEIWVSDGTITGTKMVKDMTPGSEGSNPQWLCMLGDKCYFTANTPETGEELWVTDGTETGTKIVKDIYEGGSSSPFGLTAFGDKLLFFAMDEESELIPVIDSSKPEKWLWITDGTENGTVRIGDTPTRESGIDGKYGSIGILGGKAVFIGYSPDTNETLWVTDGTAAGTKVLKDINPAPFVGWSKTSPANIDWITVVGDKALFRAETVAEVTKDKSLGVDGNIGSEIWVTDGTTDGTNWIGVDFAAGQESGAPLATQFAIVMALDENRAIFRADDGIHSVEPCIIDLSKPFQKDMNPKMIYDVNSYAFPSQKAPSWPQNWTCIYGGYVHFQANGVYHMPDVETELYTAQSLWRINVTSNDIEQINEASYLRTWSNPPITINEPNTNDNSRYFTEVKGKLYFVADDADNNSEIWCMDNNSSNPYKVHDFPDNGKPYGLNNFQDALFFVATYDGKMYRIGDLGSVEMNLENVNTIKLYPNPAVEILNIETDLNVSDVKIIDVNGRLILQEKDTKQVNVSTLQKGLYIAAILLSNGEHVSRKFTVNK